MKRPTLQYSYPYRAPTNAMIPPSAAYASHLSRALVRRPVGAAWVCSPAMALIAISCVRVSLPRSQEERIYSYVTQRIEAERDPPDPCRLWGLARRRGCGGEIGRRNLVQQRPQTNSSLLAERGRKLSLRILPALVSSPKALKAGLRQSQLLAATVRAARLNADQSVAFERQDVPAKRRSVHHHFIGQRIDRHRPMPPQPSEDGELGRTQAYRGQMPIIKLRDMARRLADGETRALLKRRQGVGRHFEFSSLTIGAGTPTYAHIRIMSRPDQEVLG